MVSVVIPVLNAGPAVASLVARLLDDRALERRGLEIVLVDDGSDGPTAALLLRLEAEHPAVRLLRHDRTLGQQLALSTGLDAARGTVLVTMDDDGAHRPEEVDRLVSCLETGHDLVYMLPACAPDGWLRRTGARLRDALFRRLYPRLGACRVSSFRALSRDLHERIRNRQVRFVYLSCLYLECNPRVANLQSTAECAASRKSRYRLASLALLLVRIAFWYGPARRLNQRRQDTCAS